MSRITVFITMCLLVLVTAISAEEPTIDDFTAMWKPLAGSWKMTNDADGKVATGVFNFRISRNKKCVLALSRG